MSVELNWQGEPLPPDFPYQGEWLHMPILFLYDPKELPSVAPSVPQFTTWVNMGGNKWSAGFDVNLLANTFGMETEAIFDANRRGLLTLDNVLANTPDGENATAKIYVFGYEGKTAEITVEALQHSGSA